MSSSDESVATVTKKGVVTAVKEGTADITVTTKEKKRTAKCTITVASESTVNPVVPVKPAASEITLKLGQFGQITVADNATLASDNEVVAKVSADGVITPKTAGVANADAMYSLPITMAMVLLISFCWLSTLTVKNSGTAIWHGLMEPEREEILR